jgi:hypothetical protein
VENQLGGGEDVGVGGLARELAKDHQVGDHVAIIV